MAEAALAEILGRMEAAIARQTTATDLLLAQAAATEDRFSRGDANVQGVVAALEQRLSESERKLADTMMAVSGTMTALQAQLEHRFTASESHMAAVLQRLAAPTTPAASGGPASTPHADDIDEPTRTRGDANDEPSWRRREVEWRHAL